MTLTDSILAAGFWSAAAGATYAYVGYPLLVGGLARAFGRPEREATIDEASLPSVACVIAAHNEAEVIEARIANALAMDYPRDRLTIIIASDGSDDETVEICCRHEPQIRLLAFRERRGKAATLNATMALLDSEIVVLSDANTFMEPDAIRALVRRFTDPKVGSVCGRLVLRDPTTGRNVDSMYWRYETFLKRCEGLLGGLLGANGAIYAIRRSLIVPLPSGTVVDDFVMPLLAKVRSGCRIAYAPDAVAHEESAPNIGGEFRRRARIGVGGFQALWMLRDLLHPRWGWTAFTFWSHKVLRWICPFLLLIALATAAALATESATYRAALLIQLGFYALCALGALVPAGRHPLRAIRILTMFACMNAALLVGFLRWMRGSHNGIWKRTARLRDVGPAA
jgi:cellulose synthase/poly-beta-1,6-N-acetylglucosamine synthase-like glycosyltransferase